MDRNNVTKKIQWLKDLMNKKGIIKFNKDKWDI